MSVLPVSLCRKKPRVFFVFFFLARDRVCPRDGSTEPLLGSGACGCGVVRGADFENFFFSLAVDKETARHEDIKDYYEFGREIGRGGFSVVVEGGKKGTSERFAIKCIKKANVERDDIKLLRREIQIMKQVDHPNILKLFEVFESEEVRCNSLAIACLLLTVFLFKEFFLVMELVDGKELFDKIVERGQYSEKDAANIVRQIISAVEYLHERGIAHRDLKPENLLSSGSDEKEVIKIADFGFSKDFTDDKLQTSCGSPGYVAPEVLTSESYDKVGSRCGCGRFFFSRRCRASTCGRSE